MKSLLGEEHRERQRQSQTGRFSVWYDSMWVIFRLLLRQTNSTVDGGKGSRFLCMTMKELPTIHLVISM